MVSNKLIQQIKIIGAKFGLGAQIRETQEGPKSIYDKLPADLKLRYTNLEYNSKHSFPAVGKSLAAVVEFCSHLAQATEAALKAHEFPIIIGGDHSIAAGSWAGVIKALDAREEFGLIWIDAHMDAHTYESSPSKAYHGMPLAALLGYGDAEFVGINGISRKLNPKHVAVVGIRSYESAERVLLEKLGIRVFYADELHSRGLKAVLTDAADIAALAKEGFGVSLDLDFFDPTYAPGVGSPETGGFSPIDFLKILPTLCSKDLKAFEIVELNPSRDIDGKTVDLAIQILKTVVENV